MCSSQEHSQHGECQQRFQTWQLLAVNTVARPTGSSLHGLGKPSTSTVSNPRSYQSQHKRSGVAHTLPGPPVGSELEAVLRGFGLAWQPRTPPQNSQAVAEARHLCSPLQLRWPTSASAPSSPRPGPATPSPEARQGQGSGPSEAVAEAWRLCSPLRLRQPARAENADAATMLCGAVHRHTQTVVDAPQRLVRSTSAEAPAAGLHHGAVQRHSQAVPVAIVVCSRLRLRRTASACATTSQASYAAGPERRASCQPTAPPEEERICSLLHVRQSASAWTGSFGPGPLHSPDFELPKADECIAECRFPRFLPSPPSLLTWPAACRARRRVPLSPKNGIPQVSDFQSVMTRPAAQRAQRRENLSSNSGPPQSRSWQSAKLCQALPEHHTMEKPHKAGGRVRVSLRPVLPRKRRSPRDPDVRAGSFSCAGLAPARSHSEPASTLTASRGGAESETAVTSTAIARPAALEEPSLGSAGQFGHSNVEMASEAAVPCALTATPAPESPGTDPGTPSVHEQASPGRLLGCGKQLLCTASACGCSKGDGPLCTLRPPPSSAAVPVLLVCEAAVPATCAPEAAGTLAALPCGAQTCGVYVEACPHHTVQARVSASNAMPAPEHALGRAHALPAPGGMHSPRLTSKRHQAEAACSTTAAEATTTEGAASLPAAGGQHAALKQEATSFVNRGHVELRPACSSAADAANPCSGCASSPAAGGQQAALAQGAASALHSGQGPKYSPRCPACCSCQGGWSGVADRQARGASLPSVAAQHATLPCSRAAHPGDTGSSTATATSLLPVTGRSCVASVSAGALFEAYIDDGLLGGAGLHASGSMCTICTSTPWGAPLVHRLK